MTTNREGIFVDKLWVETDPLPTTLAPPVPEVGLTSAPMTSLAFFLGTYCAPWNEDFIACKNETNDPYHCLKEGRKVTRCSLDLINRVEKHCKEEWSNHWRCLDMKNLHFWECRTQETELNSCVFKALGIRKVIPETPEGQEQIHEKKNPLFK